VSNDRPEAPAAEELHHGSGGADSDAVPPDFFAARNALHDSQPQDHGRVTFHSQPRGHYAMTHRGTEPILRFNFYTSQGLIQRRRRDEYDSISQ